MNTYTLAKKTGLEGRRKEVKLFQCLEDSEKKHQDGPHQRAWSADRTRWEKAVEEMGGDTVLCRWTFSMSPSPACRPAIKLVSSHKPVFASSLLSSFQRVPVSSPSRQAVAFRGTLSLHLGIIQGHWVSRICATLRRQDAFSMAD